MGPEPVPQLAAPSPSERTRGEPAGQRSVGTKSLVGPPRTVRREVQAFADLVSARGLPTREEGSAPQLPPTRSGRIPGARRSQRPSSLAGTPRTRPGPTCPGLAREEAPPPRGSPALRTWRRDRIGTHRESRELLRGRWREQPRKQRQPAELGQQHGAGGARGNTEQRPGAGRRGYQRSSPHDPRRPDSTSCPPCTERSSASLAACLAAVK